MYSGDEQVSGERTRRQPTMRDVAARAGVSVQTVSNFVNGRTDMMGEATGERVAEAMAVLDYRPNVTARGLRSSKTREIGFLVVDDEAKFLADPMNGMVMAGAGEVASANEYGLLIQSARVGEMDDGLLRPLLENRIDGGVLFLSGAPRQRDVYIRRVLELGHPFVLFGESRGDAHPCVTAANTEGAFELAFHLLDKGHRRIAFIAGQASWPMIEQRHAGYRAALREAGIDPPRELQLFRGRFDPSSGEAMAEALLGLPDPPTAVMAANDVLALGVLRAAQHRQLRIPEQLAITGFNDFDFAPFLGPGLTTASLPVYAMGRAAGRIVVDQLEGIDGRRHLEFPVEVIVRGSSDPELERSGE